MQRVDEDLAQMQGRRQTQCVSVKQIATTRILMPDRDVLTTYQEMNSQAVAVKEKHNHGHGEEERYILCSCFFIYLGPPAVNPKRIS